MERDPIESLFNIPEPEDSLSPEEAEKFELLERNIKEKICEKFGGIEMVMNERRLANFYRTIPILIMRAREEARKSADSWRKFNVGCVVEGYNEKLYELGRNPYPLFPGTNIKKREDGPKICAEQVAINSAFHDNVENEKTSVTGLVVAGNSQDEALTLRPCQNCQEIVTARLEKNGDDLNKVILVTVGLDNDNFEVFTWGEFLKLENEKSKIIAK
jgi:cytidine deaminase